MLLAVSSEKGWRRMCDSLAEVVDREVYLVHDVLVLEHLLEHVLAQALLSARELLR